MLLVCCMLLSMLPGLNVTAFAASPEGDFTVDDAGVITDYTGDGGAVDIPDTVGGAAVTGIDAYAFSFGYCNAEITEVTIPAGVDSIGAYAFLGQELTKVTFMGRCSDIDFDAFDSMDGFTVHCRPADSYYYE